MATRRKDQDPREKCSSDQCETSPAAPFEKSEHRLGTDANKRPSNNYQEEIEKQKQYYKGGKKP